MGPCETGGLTDVCTEFELQRRKLLVLGGYTLHINALLMQACEQTHRQMGRFAGTRRDWPTNPQSAGGVPAGGVQAQPLGEEPD